MPVNKVQRTQSGLFSGSKPSYFVGNDTSSIWINLSEQLGKKADELVAQEQYQKGIEDQQAAAVANEDNSPDAFIENSYVQSVAPKTTFGVSSAAYAKGANAVFALQKKQELDDALSQYQQTYANKPQEFKDNWNKSFVPEFFNSIPSHLQASFRLDASERFNRVLTSMNQKAVAATLKAEGQSLENRISSLGNDLYRLQASGQTYDSNTGKFIDDYIAEMRAAVDRVKERDPARALQLEQTIQQNIRKGEYAAHFSNLTREQRKEFLDQAERNQFDPKAKNMRGETLTPESYRQTISLLRQQHNSETQTDKADVARLNHELQATVHALTDGIGTERDQTQLLAEAQSKLKPEQYDAWKTKIARAQEYGNFLNSISPLSVPEQTALLQIATEKFNRAKELYGQNKITSDEIEWEKAKLEGFSKLVVATKKLVNDDPWNLLKRADAPKFDMKDEDEIIRARTWISEKAGIPIYSVPPMSKETVKGYAADILDDSDPMNQAGKIQALRKRLGENMFADVMERMKLDSIYYAVSSAATPQAGANILMILKEGTDLEKRADKTSKDNLNSAFNKKMGNALSFDIVQREQLRDAFLKLTLAYQERKASDPVAMAFDAVTTGRKIITLENGEKRLVAANIDEGNLRKAISEIAQNWNALGILLPPNIKITDVSMDKFSPQIVGNKLMFFSPNKIPLKIRGRNADRPEILQVDLSSYTLHQATQVEPNLSKWEAKTIKADSAVNDPEKYLAKLYADNKSALDAQDAYDPAATQITNKLYEQQQLQALSAILRSGAVPSWTEKYLRNFDALDIRNYQQFEALQKTFAAHAKKLILPGGATATPLETLMRAAIEARKVRYDVVRARREKR